MNDANTARHPIRPCAAWMPSAILVVVSRRVAIDEVR